MALRQYGETFMLVVAKHRNTEQKTEIFDIVNYVIGEFAVRNACKIFSLLDVFPLV